MFCNRLVAASLLAALLVAGPPAFAGTVTVKPGESIQEAINSAMPNDVIRLKKGNYREVLLIETTGLRLEGGGAILDARPDGPDGSGAGITVTAHDVTINNLIIRHAKNGINLVGGSDVGDGVAVFANRFSTTKLTLQSIGTNGLRIIGNEARVRRLQVHGAPDGFFFSGDDLELTRSVFVGLSSQAVEVELASDVLIERIAVESAEDGVVIDQCEDVRILRSRFELLEDDGVDIKNSSNVAVERNVIRMLDDLGVDIESSDEIHLVANRISEAEDGVESTESSGTITLTKNMFFDISDQAINLEADFLTVEGNLISGVADGDGIELVGGTVLCQENRVDSAAKNGIQVSGTTVTVVGNRITSAGNAFNQPALSVSAEDPASQVSQNRITTTFGTGIRIGAPSGATVAKNVVKNATLNGLVIQLGSTSVVVDGNRVTSALGEGIQNLGTETVITGNVVSKTRTPLTDIAGGDGIATLLGNKFGKGFKEAEIPTPEIDG